MAGKGPKFKLNWGNRAQRSYSVPGKSYDDIYKFFRRKNNADEEWGRFADTANYAYNADAAGTVTDVTLTASYTITLPATPSASVLGRKGKAAWDKMSAALSRHENGHLSIFQQQCDAFGEAIGRQPDLTVKALEKLFKKWLKEAQDAQDDYDSKTDHGAKEGVELPAPEDVSD